LSRAAPILILAANGSASCCRWNDAAGRDARQVHRGLRVAAKEFVIVNLIFTFFLSMADYTKHQQKIIKRYYDNRDSIAVQRLQELVTELYLATGKKRQQHWKSVVLHLEKLNVPKERVDILLQKDDAAELAKTVQQLAAKG
jgi:hypothetical protein